MANGRRFRVLNIVADYRREDKGQIVDFSISSLTSIAFLGRLRREDSRPGSTDRFSRISVAAGDCARQRSGADQRSQVLVVGASGCAVTIHRSGQTDPKCLGRKFPGSGTAVSTSIGSPVWQTLGRRWNLGASITIASGLTVLYRSGLRRRCGKNGRRPRGKTAPREPWKTLLSFPLSHRPDDDKLSLRKWT